MAPNGRRRTSYCATSRSVGQVITCQSTLIPDDDALLETLDLRADESLQHAK